MNKVVSQMREALPGNALCSHLLNNRSAAIMRQGYEEISPVAPARMEVLLPQCERTRRNCGILS
jgi:hypothetical protein